MITFQGQVESVIFENDSNLFKILNVSVESKIPDWILETITVTGTFGEIDVDVTYEFTGQMVHHDKFGDQFACQEYHEVIPSGKTGLIKFLSGDNFKGIGTKTAEEIVAKLGDQAINKIKQDNTVIEDLAISQKQKDTLLTQVNNMDSFSDQLLKLTQLGISRNVATKMYQVLKDETLLKLRDNPYILVSKINGYGFSTADAVGHNLGFTYDAPERIQGAILQILQDDLATNGNTYLQAEQLVVKSCDLLNQHLSQQVSFDQVVLELNHLQEAQLVIVDHEDVFLGEIFKLEWKIAETLADRIQAQSSATEISAKKLTTVLDKVQAQLKIQYDEVQLQAIKQALTNPISILTGGPGTGKTTIIAGILRAEQLLAGYADQEVYKKNSPFVLAAPTGRAAKRMTETTGINASTIHRLIGLGHGNQAISDELNEINGDLLIIDEMSMVDMYLFELLLGSINQTKHIIFVGDQDQLPSVGAGNVFADLITSGIIPTTKLQHVHRQSGDSSIIELAHQINHGQTTEVFTKTQNSSFIEAAGSQIESVVRQVVDFALAKGFAKSDVQILGSMYKSASGVDHLNQVLQNQLNPKSAKRQKEIVNNDVSYRISDRVLQLTNNPEKDIYNGQIGQITALDPKHPDKMMTVDFDGHQVTLAKNELKDITLAYAITIHKSQGSEFPLVILSLTMQNSRMLRRNLLYTAVTRAQKSLVMVGERRAFEKAISTPGNDRQTKLAARILQLLKPVEPEEETPTEPQNFYLTRDLIINNEIDPMIGMEEVKFG